MGKKMRNLIEPAFVGMCVFVVGFTLTAAIYGAIVSDRFIERGTVPALSIAPLAILVSVPLAGVSAYGAYRVRRRVNKPDSLG